MAIPKKELTDKVFLKTTRELFIAYRKIIVLQA